MIQSNESLPSKLSRHTEIQSAKVRLEQIKQGLPYKLYTGTEVTKEALN